MEFKEENIYANCRSWTLSHFSKMSNDCKSNVSEDQRCIQLNSISVGKEITGIASRPTGILQHLEVFYILF